MMHTHKDAHTATLISTLHASIPLPLPGAAAAAAATSAAAAAAAV